MNPTYRAFRLPGGQPVLMADREELRSAVPIGGPPSWILPDWGRDRPFPCLGTAWLILHHAAGRDRANALAVEFAAHTVERWKAEGAEITRGEVLDWIAHEEGIRDVEPWVL